MTAQPSDPVAGEPGRGALFIYFWVASSVFLTSQNLLNLVFQNATIGIAACAVTLTIIAGNFDLSLGSIFVLSEVLAAYAAVHMGVWWSFPVAIVSGAVMGLINGLLVTKLRVNAFLATLATALSFGGIAVGVTHGGLLITPSSSVATSTASATTATRLGCLASRSTGP